MEPNHRRCVSCRAVAPKSVLWRIVRQYDTGIVQPDCGMGRSAYLCPNFSCLALAQKKKRLSKALKAPIPEEIYQQLRQRLKPSSSQGDARPNDSVIRD